MFPFLPTVEAFASSITNIQFKRGLYRHLIFEEGQPQPGELNIVG